MQENFLKVIKKNWEIILIFPLILGFLSFSISAFLPVRYSSEVKILVIQKQPNDKVDAFSAAKSAEYLGDVLSRMIYTDSFIDDVKNSSLDIKWNFSSSSEKRKKEWAKEIDIKKINNTGILEIKVLDRSKAEAKKISEAIANNFINNGKKYHGGGDNVEIKLIDGPIVSDFQASPNILLNIIFAFAIGLIGSLSWAYYHNFSRIVLEKEDKKNYLNDKINFFR